MFATTLLACRLTAGPPPRQTETPLAPTSPAFVATSSPPPLPGTKETSGRTSPTLTPIVLPSPTPLPTLLDHLAEGMPAIQPRNWAEVRRLARFGEEGQPAFTSLDFSRDGQFMAAVTCEQALKLWEVPGGEQLPGPTGEVSSGCEGSWKAAFSPVAGLLATTGNALIDESAWNVVQLWTVSRDFGSQSLQSLPASRKPVTSLAFSPDGRLLAAGTQENSLILWFIPEPDQPHTTTITKLGELVHTDWVVDVAFSPDGRILAAATAEPESDRFTPVIHLWPVQELLAKEIGAAAPAVTLEAPAGPLRKVTFSPDGRWLAAAGSGITIWEAQTGKQRLFLEAPADTLAFSPDSRLLAAAGRDLFLFWDLRASLRSGKIEAQDWMELQGVEGDIAGLSFSPDGIALGMISEDGSLILWGIWPEG